MTKGSRQHALRAHIGQDGSFPGDLKLAILVVEDSKSTQMVLEKKLTAWNCTVTVCSDGFRALELISQQTFDLIMTDWIMPNMDGMELIERIRNLELEVSPYIVVLTGLTNRENLLHAFDKGADDYLTKPVDFGELHARIRAASRIVHLENELFEKNRQLTLTMDRMRKDLEAGAELQLSLIPSQGFERDYTLIDFCFQPSTELAGDIFNFFPVESSKVIVYLLDVSGHGVKAALLAVTLSRLMNPQGSTSVLHKSFSHTGSSTLADPQDVAMLLNREFQIEKNHGQFFTMIYGILDTEEQTFSYVCAGHPPMIFIDREGNAKVIEGQDIPIGFLNDYQYSQYNIHFQDGDRLYLYSDGIIEAGNKSGNEYSIERMRDFLVAQHDQSLKQGMTALMESIAQWCSPNPCEDDISIVGIEMIEDSFNSLDLPQWNFASFEDL